MSLHDTIAADGINVFCNADDFAEPVIYTKTTGATRTIDAVVVRDAWVAQPGTNSESPLLEIHVANDGTLGISSSELLPGRETITVAVRVGETATARTIQRIVSHDEGMLVLECR